MIVRETINGFRIDGVTDGHRLYDYLTANGYWIGGIGECWYVKDNHYRGKAHLIALLEDYERCAR